MLTISEQLDLLGVQITKTDMEINRILHELVMSKSLEVTFTPEQTKWIATQFASVTQCNKNTRNVLIGNY
jgi:hypothetical protein